MVVPIRNAYVTERLQFIEQVVCPVLLSEKLPKSKESWYKMRTTRGRSRIQVFWNVTLVGGWFLAFRNTAVPSSSGIKQSEDEGSTFF